MQKSLRKREKKSASKLIKFTCNYLGLSILLKKQILSSLFLDSVISYNHSKDGGLRQSEQKTPQSKALAHEMEGGMRWTWKETDLHERRNNSAGVLAQMKEDIRVSARTKEEFRLVLP